MREIVIISGKGGAGKTSIASAFAHLARNTVICDLDVDAPDMHILLQPQVEESHEFRSGHEAVINQNACTACGLCEEVCQFDAVHHHEEQYTVDALACEGCKTCVALCPATAIAFNEKYCGNWFISTTRFGTLVHAQLFPGEENSGRLVSQLKTQARIIAKGSNADFILADGSPGIGCPVISSLQGAHLAVIVTEPTPSGVHDFERVATLCDFFRIRVAVLINKADLNAGQTANIKATCETRGYTHVGDIPFDQRITQAMLAGQTITEFVPTEEFPIIANAWETIVQLATQPSPNSKKPFATLPKNQ